MSYKKQELLTLREHLSSTPVFWWGLCYSYLVSQDVLLFLFTFRVPCCDVRYDFCIKLCLVRLYLQLFVGGLMFYLRYLCLLAHSGVKHIVLWFLLFFFVLYMFTLWCCQFLLIVHSVFYNVYLVLWGSSTWTFCVYIEEMEIKGSVYLLFVFLEKPMYEVCLIRIKNQVREKKSTIGTHKNTDSLLKYTSTKHYKYDVNQKLGHFYQFRELFGQIRMLLYKIRFVPSYILLVSIILFYEAHAAFTRKSNSIRIIGCELV